MKPADEIKKGLECCIESTCEPCCPYGNAENCNFAIYLLEDVLAYIRQLESDKQQLEGMLHHMNQLRDAAADRALKMEERVHQLEAELDAAVRDLREADIIECEHCKHYREYDSECGYECQTCARDCMCGDCYKNSHWEWRGVQKEE